MFTFLKNVPMQVYSIILIILGTILGALSAFKDNKTITELLLKNESWSKTMDNKVEENVQLSQQIIATSKSLENISSENAKILEENSQINGYIEKIVGKIETITKKTEEISTRTSGLTENINTNSEAIKFFNSVDFSYLNRIFPIGFTVFRQNKLFEDFKKTYGDKRFYEQFDIKIIQNGLGKFSIDMSNIRFMPSQIQMIGGTIGRNDFNPHNYETLQFLSGVEIVPNMTCAVLMINDGYEYTFAVGWVYNDR